MSTQVEWREAVLNEKPLVGYEVSTDGSVRRSLVGQSLPGITCIPRRKHDGRYYLTLGIPRREVPVHRLVMETFHQQTCPEGFVVRHKDGRLSNNQLDNLCYAKRSGGPRRKTETVPV